MSSIEMPIFHIICFALFALLTGSQSGPRNTGTIVPPDPNNKTTQEAIYNPTGKKPAPNHPPPGVPIPTHLMYGKGTVHSPQKKPPSGHAPAVTHQTHVTHSVQHVQRPPQPLAFASLITQLLGGVTSQTPSDSGNPNDVNIQVVQPFYNRPGGYYYGPASISVQSGRPVRYQARPMYGSYQRYGQDVFGNDEVELI